MASSQAARADSMRRPHRVLVLGAVGLQLRGKGQELLANGLNARTVHHVRRTVTKAPDDAVRRRRIPRNPVTLAHTPRYDAPDVVPLTVPEAKRLLAAAREEPNGAA